MPMSHMGLTVSHIPSATSFYLTVLQPLGYRYIGHQGDSIGLGVDSADFFLTQAPVGTRPSPNHLAFLAESRLIVRECYAAALNSGALPSGAPNYRNDDCSCFNAAVEDLDGNTVEFIFRQPHGAGDECGTIAPPEDQRVITWQKDVASTADDAQSVAQSMVSRGSLASKASKAKSRMQTALDLASNTSKSVKSEAPSQGISRTQTAPAKSDFPSKTLIGTALGAAAGAALMFAMTREESKNAQEEADHLTYMSKSRPRRHSVNDPKPSAPRAETIKESIAPPPVPPKPDSRKFHRNFSTTESAFSRRPPIPETRAMRMIEATGYNDDATHEIQEVLSRYSGLKAMPTRSRTIDDYEYAPKSKSGRSEAPSGYSMKRATTLPVEAIEDRPNYYLEAPPPKSSFSRHSNRYETPRSYASSSHRRSSYDDVNLKRHDSGVSMHSSRSRRDRERESDAGGRASGSKASTIKPRKDSAYENAAAVAAAVPQVAGSKAPSSCYWPAAISLPPSHVSSKAERYETSSKADRHDRYEASRARSKAPTSYVSAPAEPLEPVASKQSWEDFVGEESDGLGDIKTVVPDDSISCVDLSKPRVRRSSHSSRHSHHSSRHSSRRSEAESERTVRPARKDRDRDGGSKHTVLPYRGKGKEREREREGKRSILGFA